MEKKNKRTLKIIIIIILILLLLLGGVLGLVFGLKNKSGNPSVPPSTEQPGNPNDPSNPTNPNNPGDSNNPTNPTNPNTPTNPDDPGKPEDPPTENFEEQQKQFVEQFNNSIQIDEAYDFSSAEVVNTSGEAYGSTASYICGIYDRGYIAKTSIASNTKDFYIYRYDAEGKKYAVSFKNILTDELNFEENIVPSNIVSTSIQYKNGFLAYKYNSQDNSHSYLDVVYVDEVGKITLVNRIQTTIRESKFEFDGELYDEFNIAFKENYYLVEFYVGEYGTTREVKAYKIFEFDSHEGSTKTGFMVKDSNAEKCYYTPMGLIVEQTGTGLESGSLVEYSYEIFDFKTGNKSQLQLEDGEAKLEFGTVADTECYYKVSHVRDGEGNVEIGGVITYYDASGKEIFSYDAKDSDDLVLGGDDSHILTKNGILTITGQKHLNYQIEFESFAIDGTAGEVELQTDLICGTIFTVKDAGEKFSLVSIDGTVVGSGYDAISRCGKTFILEKDETYFIYNLESKAIENVQSGFDYEHSGLWAGGIYIIHESGKFSVLNYMGEVIYDNVSRIEFAVPRDSNMPLTYVGLYDGRNSLIALIVAPYQGEEDTIFA